MQKIVAFILFSLPSCDFLEVTPQQAIDIDIAYSNTRDLEIALVGAYNSLQHVAGMGGHFTLFGDLMTDNAVQLEPLFIEIAQLDISTRNRTILGNWINAYQAINDVNLILEAIPHVNDSEIEFSEDRIRGECLALRGAVHFELVRFYGRPFGANSTNDLGIPIMMEGVSSVEDLQVPARATVNSVYQQVIDDFKEAVTLLQPTGERGRFNRMVCIGYLSEIAFQQGNYQEAADFAGNIINSRLYDLTPEPKDFFINEGSSEEIWAIIHTDQDNFLFQLSLTELYNVNVRGGSIIINPDLVENGYKKIISPSQQLAINQAGFLVDDLRISQLTVNDTINVEKYEQIETNADDAPRSRLAEIYLIRAESLAHSLGLNQESVDLLNLIRTRALRITDMEGNVVPNSDDFVSYSVSDFTSEDDLIEAVIIERRVELAFEGQYFHDLSRLGRDIQPGSPAGADNVVWPIPERAINSNQNLDQNPGY